MDITKLDERLAAQPLKVTDVAWHSPFDTPFSIHGMMYDENLSLFLRMPDEVSVRVSPSVRGLSRMTSGGRVRVRTDSVFVALSCVIPCFNPAPHMAMTTMGGFSVYVDGQYRGKVGPSYNDILATVDKTVAFRGSCSVPKTGELHDIEIYFPLYGCVKELYIGLREGCRIEAPRAYTYPDPIVFYGSSITQGACASRPGNDYAAHLSRMLDADYINLGFSGNGNAEPEMLEYLTKLPASAYIFDYNYYSDRPERVLPPHLSIYELLRKANPTAAIIMVDKPSTIYSPKNYETRNAIIRASYEETVRRGDDLVGYLDGKDFFGHEVGHDACVVDSDHPNDLGFWQMAKSLYPILNTLLARREIKKG